MRMAEFDDNVKVLVEDESAVGSLPDNFKAETDDRMRATLCNIR